MIKGLRIKVTSTELKNHLTTKAGYHEERAKEKEATLPQLREMLEQLKVGRTPQTVSHMNKSGYHLDTDDPVNDLERDIRDHNNKALAYRYLAAHLFDEDYDLEESDLIRLEILKR